VQSLKKIAQSAARQIFFNENNRDGTLFRVRYYLMVCALASVSFEMKNFKLARWVNPNALALMCKKKFSTAIFCDCFFLFTQFLHFIFIFSKCFE